jgi:hypothetical protein
VGGNTAEGNVQVSNNSGGGDMTDNVAGGNCQYQKNSGWATGSGNHAGPGRQNSCPA